MRMDRKIGAVLLIVGAVYAYLITQLPSQRMPDDVGEALVPWLTVGVFVLLSLILIVKKSNDGGVEAEEITVSEEQTGRPRSGHGVLTIAAMAVYIAVLPYIGFFISTLAFAFGMMRWAGSRRLGVDVVIAVVATLVIQLTFTEVLMVPLPTGSWLDGLLKHA